MKLSASDQTDTSVFSDIRLFGSASATVLEHLAASIIDVKNAGVKDTPASSSTVRY